MKDTYSLSEGEINSFFDDDGGGMDDATLSGIHGKWWYYVIIIKNIIIIVYSNRGLTVAGRYSDIVVWTGQ